MGSPLGTCRLCLAEGVALQRSHILPAWAYRKARSSAPGVPDPVMVHGGKAVQTSSQFTEYLLCSSCEQVFSDAERYVEPLVFPETGLASILETLRPIATWATDPKGIQIGFAALRDFDLERITRFAASIFWRSHVAQRENAGQVRLGATFGERFRKYLRGEAPFPPACALRLVVLDPREDPVERALCGVVSVPTSAKEPGGIYRHHLVIHGLAFILMVSTRGALDHRHIELSLNDVARPGALLLWPSRVGPVRSVGSLFPSKPVGALAKRIAIPRAG